MAVDTLETLAPGDITEHNGMTVKVAANGALRRVDNGQIVKGPDNPPFADPLKAQNASYQRHHGKRQEAILAAVQRSTGDAGTLYKDYSDADGYLTGVIVEEVVLNSDERGKDRVDAWRAVLAESGTSGVAPKQAAGSSSDVTISVPREIVADIVAAAMAAAQRKGSTDA